MSKSQRVGELLDILDVHKSSPYERKLDDVFDSLVEILDLLHDRLRELEPDTYKDEYAGTYTARVTRTVKQTGLYEVVTVEPEAGLLAGFRMNKIENYRGQSPDDIGLHIGKIVEIDRSTDGRVMRVRIPK